MKKFFYVSWLLLVSGNIFSQVTVDTLIDTGIYQSFFSYTIREPLYVTYVLSKGGGGCPRTGLRFISGGVPHTATNKDYAHSGFEQGHLANAEDFAFDCAKDKLTFRFYNCVPQTLKLNRGIWKVWEGKVRDESQTTKLFIIAGSIFTNKKIGPGPGDKIGVPDQCYKIVFELGTKKLLHCLIFDNDDSDSVEEISLDDLRKKLKYPLMPAAWWKSRNK